MGERVGGQAWLAGVLVVAAAGTAVMLARGPARRYPYMFDAGPRSGPAPDGWREDRLAIDDGVTLRVFVRPGPSMVWWMDGNGPATLAEGARHASAVLPPDVGVTVIAPRGFDGSGGSLNPDTMGRDAVALRELAHAHTPDPVVFAGFSLGSIFAVRAAASNAQACALLLAPLTDIGISPGKNAITRRLSLHRYDSRAIRLPGPALALRGALDEDSGPADLAAVQNMGPRAEVITVSKVGHADLPQAPETKKAVQRFVERCRSTVTQGTP